MSRNFPREVSRLFVVQQFRHFKKEFRARRRPFWALEGLEHRVLLAGPDIFMVVDNSLSDAERGSLTNALALADNDPNPDGAYVEFDPSIYNASNPFNITLTSTLVLSNTAGPEEILNLGGGSVTISGGGTTGVFQIEKGVTATLSNMTITGGFEAGNTGTGGGIAVEAGGSLEISGSTIEDNTAVSGGGIADAGSLTISQSTIEDNSAAFEGGGVDVEPVASLAVSNSTIEGNSAFAGGGIANAGSLTISQSSINQNSAVFDGGAVYSSGTLVDVEYSMILENHTSQKGGAGIVSIGTSSLATMKIDGSVVSGNTAGGGVGAGVLDAQCKLIIKDSTIADNSGATSGGGIAVIGNSGLSASVTDSTISGNKAAVGGGILVASGALTITGSTISGNTATSDGGGVAGTLAAVTITNSTIAANSAATGGGIDIGFFLGALTIYDSTIAYNVVAGGPGSGGGIDSAAGSTPNIGTVLYNTIVAMNTDGTGADAVADDIAGVAVSTSSQYNLVGADETGSLADGSNGNQVGVVDPGLGLLSSSNGGTTQTIALLSGSPAINAGDTSLVPGDVATDERGSSRVYGPTVDIGAYESDSTQVGPWITFPPIGTQVYPSAPIQLNATDSDGKGVDFTLISGPADLSGNSLTLTGGGTVVVEASEVGNPSYPPSPVVESFKVLSATIFTVDLTSDSGQTLGPNEGDLLYCITQANLNTNSLGSLIEFDSSVFQANTSYTIDLSNTLELSETAGPEVIDGPGASVLTINGEGIVGVFQVDDGVTATLSGLTISGGSASLGGGVIVAAEGSLKVADSSIEGNSASEGGGVFNSGALTIADSTIASNNATFGGGIAVTGGALTISDSTLSENSATWSGGGIFNEGGTPTVTNSTIADNSAQIDGGGIDNLSGTVTTFDTTIAYNEALGGSASGAGIFDASSSTTTLNNTIVALNTDGSGAGARADDIAGSAVSSSSQFNLVGVDETGSLTDGTNGNEVGVADPGLGSAPADNGGPTLTLSLVAGSPAINAGSSSLIPTNISFDQRGPGHPRVVGPSVDIGAVESTSTQLSQWINFGPIANQFSSNAPIYLSATDSAGLPVTFNVLSGPAIISGNVLTLTGGGGTVTVEGSQAGNSSYAAAIPVDQSFTVTASTVFTVNSTSDTGETAGPNQGDLLYCITQANNTTNPAGSVIEFDPSVFIAGNSYIITLSSTLALTETAGPVVIDGPGATVVTISGGGNVGVFQVDDGVLARLTGLTISGGSASVGAGIDVAGTLAITDSTVEGNTAIGGGGIENDGTLLVMDSALASNSAYYGGGIENDGSLTVTNSTIADNTSLFIGGGIYLPDGTATIVNSTIAYNEVVNGPDRGAGVYGTSSSPAILNNTIVELNTDGSGGPADDIAGNALSSSSASNLVGVDETGSLTNGTNGNQVGVTVPGLGVLANNGGPTETIALLAGSLAINAGNSSLAVDASNNPLIDDQRGPGYPRMVGPSVDIGAFESNSTQLSQSIEFAPLGGQTYEGVPVTLALSATASSLLSVSFTVISGPATVSENMLTITGGGTVIIEASQAGNSTYAAAIPVDQSLEVNTGTIYTVDATTDSGAGSGLEGDLRYCITQANNNTNPLGSLIEFDPSVFATAATIELTSTLTLGETVGPEAIQGPGASIVTISGGAKVGVFEVNRGVAAVLVGLTISGGDSSYAGGGINIAPGGTLTITESTISNNTARFLGGGINDDDGTLKAADCIFERNSASVGGAIFDSSGSVSVSSSVISSNKAGTGGGIYIYAGELTLTQSTISDNSAASFDGGGVYDTGANARLVVADSTIANNMAGDFGGGIGIGFGPTATITDSTIANNSARSGGGIDVESATLTTVNTTIAYNNVSGGSGSGGGIHTVGNSITTFYNTIVALNTDSGGANADDIAGDAVSSSSAYNLVGADETGSLAGGTGNQVGVTNPGLGTLASNGGPTLTIALLTGSPAIAAGSEALAVDPQGNPLLYDQRGQGYPRTYGGNVDIGAFEANPNQQSQTIDFSTIAAQEYGASLTMAATASSGLPVSFVLISGPATLSGDVLTVTGVGTVDVEASQAGNGTFAAATPVDQSFTVNPAATDAIVASLVNPSVDGEYVSFKVNIANAGGTSMVPEGRVQFVVNGPSGTTDLGGPVRLTGGTATSPTVALAAGTDTVEAYFSDPAGNFSPITGILSGGQTVNTMTAQNLEIVLETTSTPTISAATNDDLQAIVSAVNGLSGQGTSVTITVELGGGTFNDSTFSPPAGVTVVVIGNGTTTTFVGQSPAIVVTQGDVIISDVTFTTATDAPTILVSGGSLELRDDVIQESTGFTDAAISLAGGTLDLGTAADPGGNMLDVNGLGEFVHNTSGNSVPAAGDTFEVNGAAVSAPYLSFTSLATSAASSVYGQSVTLTATIQANIPSTGTLTGSVDFVDTTTNTDLGSVSVADGSASLTTTGLGAGEHMIRAFYSGNGNFTLSLDSLTQGVTPKALTVTAVISVPDIGHGASVPIPTASFSGFTNGDTGSVVSGTVSFTGLPTSVSPAGIYTVTPITTGLSAANYTFPNVVAATLNVHPVVTDILVEWGSESMSIKNLSRDLPFSDITGFKVEYSDPVNISGTGFLLTSTAGGTTYAPSKGGSGQGVTAETWTLPTAIGIDRLMLALDQTNTVATSAPALKLFGLASLSFSVLPGDFNGDGVVSSADMTDINNATVGAYDVWADLLGTGTVNINDVKLARSKIGTSLPPAS